ncbi:MAG: hypothetical protein AABY53_05185 [Bdellovibrionota bacterium]
MSSIIQGIIKLVILACLVLGGVLILKTTEEENFEPKKNNKSKNNQPKSNDLISNPKALALKKYLLTYGKPARVEVFNYTKRFTKDVSEILEMKIATDSNSNFYITVQFFTDENDLTAPLVAQVRILDIKNNNITKEHSINLD